MWADIAGYEGRYQVDQSGQVRNVKSGRILKSHVFRNHYVGIILGRGSKTHLVHRLVATAFIPGDTSLQVNHKNGKRGDNRVENLEWLSCSDNHRHSYRELKRKKHCLTKTVLLSKGDSTMQFDSVISAAKALGVVPGSVASAENNSHRCRGWVVSYV